MLPPAELLSLLRARLHHPARVQEIVRLLHVAREARPALRRQLKGLAASGDLVVTRGGLYGLPEKMDLVAGRLRMHPQGYGFVEAERPAEGLAGDVHVAAPNLDEAMHGDRVLVRIERRKDGDQAEGRIVRVLERGSPTIVGRFDADAGGAAYVVPFDRRLTRDVHVPRAESRGARSGDMVAVEITRWPTPTRNPAGRVVEVLGDPEDPGVDVAVVIRQHGLPDAHGRAAVGEAARLGPAVRERDLAGRTDFRETLTVTIDGEHARDFDDAISIERLPSGHYRLGVHIADVAHYVAEGSALDEEARARGTSVYFPERAIHMFPERLATGVCSLNPGVDRLVQSCLMEVDAAGEVRRFEIRDGVIRSRARMTYTDVNAILTDRDPVLRGRHTDLVPALERMAELFEILNARRRRRGSVDFDLPEPEVLLDASGLVEAIIPSERNVAHRLIEEFMLLANETVAGFLEHRAWPALYRVHERPDPVKVAEFAEFVASLGHALAAPPESVEPRHFQRLVEQIRGTPEERPVAFLMLRTMQKARYDPANLGHFGLAAPCYTHFTSPIRRYPDLLVHRALREVRRGRLREDEARLRAQDLAEMARHVSDMERRADDAERELVQWKKVRFMADKVGDEFDGYITGVAPFGLFVELVEHFVEGLVHVSSMADDYYHYDERRHVMRGDSGRRLFRLGDRVRVQVARVDLERRQIDLGLVEILDAVRRSGGERTAQRSSRPRGHGGKRPQRAARPGRRERAVARGPRRRGRS